MSEPHLHFVAVFDPELGALVEATDEEGRTFYGFDPARPEEFPVGKSEAAGQ